MAWIETCMSLRYIAVGTASLDAWHNRWGFDSSGDGFAELPSVRRATVPDDPAQLREEAICLWALGRLSECCEGLQAYLDAAPTAPDTEHVRACAQTYFSACSA